MKKSLNLLWALPCFVLLSCKKDEIASTDIYDPYDHMKFVIQNSDTPVPGATVYLLGWDNSYYVIDQLTTDLNGDVSWLKNSEVREISVVANGYWNEATTFHLLNSPDLQDDVFEMLPKAWIKIDAHDNEPINDEIIIEHSGGVNGTSGYYELMDDIPFTHPWVGNDNDFTLYIRYSHFENFELVLDSTTSMNFWVEPNDTLRWTLYY